MPEDLFARLDAAPGVADAVAEARAAVDKLLSHRILRRRSAEVSAESALRDARASAALDGHGIGLAELRDGLAGDTLPPRVTGAVTVAAALGESMGVFERAPRQVLARLHVLALGPSTDDARGRPRADGEPVEDPLGLGSPPSALEASARLSGLVDALVAPTRASALVVAAVVHAELVTLRVFGSADGVVARAAERLVLVGRGLDPKAVGQPTVGHAESGGYAEALAAYSAGDPVAFVRQTCAAVALGAREGLALAEAMQRE